VASHCGRHNLSLKTIHPHFIFLTLFTVLSSKYIHCGHNYLFLKGISFMFQLKCIAGNTCRKVASSIPNVVMGIFDIILPAALEPWGKGDRCQGLTTLPPSCANRLEIWEPQGLFRPVHGLLDVFFRSEYFVFLIITLRFIA